MLYLLAKALEVSGLLTLGWALYIGLSGQEMYIEVGLLAVGSIIFYVGRGLERRARGRP